jgi:hypothetical protein
MNDIVFFIDITQSDFKSMINWVEHGDQNTDSLNMNE